MKNIRDFDEHEIDTLTEMAIKYAKTYNLYMDCNASERDLEIVGFECLDYLLFSLGFHFEKINKYDEDSLSHFVLDEKGVI